MEFQVVSKICYKFKVNFLCTEYNFVLLILDFQTTNFLRFMILHNFRYTAQIKYLNNIVEQDHRSVKLIIFPMLGFQSFRSANKTLKRIEAMNLVKKDKSII